jgi:hypothetical protein
MAGKLTQHVTLRLAAGPAAKLAALAEAAGLSPGQAAKLLLQQALLDERGEALGRALDRLAEETHRLGERLERFEEKFAHAVLQLLVNAGQADVRLAREYVRSHLLVGGGADETTDPGGGSRD